MNQKQAARQEMKDIMDWKRFCDETPTKKGFYVVIAPDARPRVYHFSRQYKNRLCAAWIKAVWWSKLDFPSCLAASLTGERKVTK